MSQRAKLTRRPRHPERRHRPRKPVAVEQSVVIKAGEVFEVRLERLG